MSKNNPILTHQTIRQAVVAQYGRVAQNPFMEHPFPVGRAFAESLGYPAAILDSLPHAAVSAFAGISYPLKHAEIMAGEVVLDLGCGAGMDTILIADLVGLDGVVHSVDLSQEMISAAQENAASAKKSNIHFHTAPVEELPLQDETVDVVHVNGIFNLCPDKHVVMEEVFRVLLPGGRMLVSEIVMKDSVEYKESSLEDISLEEWFR